jgi:hypothetical protein
MRTIALTAVVSLVLSTMVALPAPGAAMPLPAGSSERRLSLADARLTVFTYRPACRDPSLLLVFHGQGHNAADYRDWARPLADKHCMLVVAPRFSKSQFPRWRYQHGGIARDGEVQDPREWSGHGVIARRLSWVPCQRQPECASHAQTYVQAVCRPRCISRRDIDCSDRRERQSGLAR